MEKIEQVNEQIKNQIENQIEAIKKRRRGLTVKLMAITVLPVVLGMLLLFLACRYYLADSLHQMSSEKLSGIAVSLTEAYNELYSGDWNMRNDKIYKGNSDVSDTYELIDNIKKKQEVDVTIFYGDTRIMTTVKNDAGERIEGTKCEAAIYDTVINNGKEYFSEKAIVNNEKYYAYYEPLFNSDGSVTAMLFVGVPASGVSDMIGSIVVKVIIFALILLAIDGVIVVMISLNMIKTIKNCSDAIYDLSTGSLNVNAKTSWFNRKDELSELAEGINNVAASFVDITGQIKDSSSVMNNDASRLAEISDNTHRSILEVSSAIEEVANGATQQASDIQDASNSIDMMSNSIDTIADKIDVLSQTAMETQNTSSNAEHAMGDLISIINQTKESIDKIVSQSELNVHAAAKIQEVVQVIAGISSQTNLLSLNASIEAARAGEQGKGFAVVADEIRKLAEESSDSAGKIETIITELVQNIHESLTLSDVLKGNANEQINKLEVTRKDFNKVVSDVGEMFERTSAVKDEIENITVARDKIQIVIESLSAISQENAASSEETTATTNIVVSAMDELNSFTESIRALAKKLDEIIAYFH